MKLYGILALGLLCNHASAGEYQALEAPEVGREAVAEALAFPAGFPPGSQPVELERWVFGQTTFSARPFPRDSYVQHPGRKVGTLGSISYTPFSGGHPLYACQTNDGQDFFTSTTMDCEGHRKMVHMPILGYVASHQLPGTVPLYRCIRGGFKPRPWADHFDTVDPHCEGQPNPTNEGIRGYIWL